MNILILDDSYLHNIVGGLAVAILRKGRVDGEDLKEGFEDEFHGFHPHRLDGEDRKEGLYYEDEGRRLQTRYLADVAVKAVN